MVRKSFIKALNMYLHSEIISPSKGRSIPVFREQNPENDILNRKGPIQPKHINMRYHFSKSAGT